MYNQDVQLESPIVIDNGTGMIKAGFAGNPKPRYRFPSYVGIPKHKRSMFAKQNIQTGDELYVGEEAQKMRGVLKLHYPMKHGVITKLEDMVALWEHVYHLMSVQHYSDHPVLLTEAPLNPKKNRNQMIEQFFDKFNVPALFVAEQAILALYASGRTTGVVLDSGHGVTHCVPVFEGFSLPHAITRMDVAGADVTEHLNRILRKYGINFHTSAEMQTVQDIKEKVCCVRKTSKKHTGISISQEHPTKYALPDGKTIHIGNNVRDGAAEVLFDPSLIGLEYSGIQNCVADAIAKSELDLRRKLSASIVLSGGSTMFKGFGERMLEELSAPDKPPIKIFAPVDRMLSTWVGGSILSCLHTFKNMWITRKQYQEHGTARGLY